MLKPKWIVLISALLMLPCQPATYAKRVKHALHGASISKDPNYKFFKSAYAYTDYGVSTMDVNKFFYCISPNVVYRGANGHVYTLDEMKQDVYVLFKQLYDHNVSLSRSTQVLSITYSNNKAIVMVRSHVSGSVPTRYSSTPFVASGDTTREDLWERSPNGWSMIDTRELSSN